jgi:hypothetical protein
MRERKREGEGGGSTKQVTGLTVTGGYTTYITINQPAE